MPDKQCKVGPLLRLGKANGAEWPNYVERYDLTEADIPALIALVIDQELHKLNDSSTEVWAPVHAWRALAQLKASQAVEPLITTFDCLDDDDWALEELPLVMAMIGPVSLEPLISCFQQPVVKESSHVLAMSCLAQLALAHSDVRSRVVEAFQAYLRNPDQQALMLNSCLVCNLLELEAKEAIDEIRHVFALDCVDLMYVGDIEDVEIQLGLRDQRETPKPYGHPLTEYEQALRELLEPPGSFEEPYVRPAPKVGRNDPCPCGSGKKHKKCCGTN